MLHGYTDGLAEEDFVLMPLELDDDGDDNPFVEDTERFLDRECGWFAVMAILSCSSMIYTVLYAAELYFRYLSL
jgi:hypothetical protein